MKSQDNPSGRALSESAESENVVTELIPNDIEYQAAHWLAVLDGDNPCAEDIAAFHSWKNQDPAHRKAFEELLDLWGDLNTLTKLEPPASRARAATSRFSFMLPGSPLGNIGAAACALLMVVGLFVIQPWNSAANQTYITQIGEQKTILLPDNSQIILNTNSQVEVDYSADRRLLTLQKGEAHFEVAHDPERPFDVYAGTGRVKAIGTAFTVRMAPKNKTVAVYVTEGVVEVFSDAEAVPNSAATNYAQAAQLPTDTVVRVPAGRQALYGRDNSAEVSVEQATDMQDKLSWHEGNLVFNGEPLGAVIEEFSRYTSTKIIIPAKKMRTMKVGGIFKIGDTVAMLDALENGFGIHAKYISDDIIYLVFEEDK